jgi:hypothetical protein
MSNDGLWGETLYRFTTDQLRDPQPEILQLKHGRQYIDCVSLESYCKFIEVHALLRAQVEELEKEIARLTSKPNAKVYKLIHGGKAD